MQLRLGLVLAGQFLASDDPVVRMREAVEQVRLARDTGFTSVFVTHHFLADFQFFQPVPFLARLAAEADGMQFGTGVLLVPMYPPVLLAEELATLDVITGGNLILGAGAGYRDVEFRALGVPQRERMQRFDDTLSIMRRLWAGESVTQHSERTQLDDARLTLRPVQGGDVPVWVGATGPKGLRHAADVGDEWFVSPELDLAGILQRQQVYLEALGSRGNGSSGSVRPVMREAFAAASVEKAVATAGPALRTKYEAYARWGHPIGEFDDMVENSFVLGDPARCVEQLRRYQSEVGTSLVALRMQWPGLEQRDVLAGIEQFGAVISELR